MKKFCCFIVGVIGLCAFNAFAACDGNEKTTETPKTYTVTIAVNDSGYGSVDKTMVENVAKGAAIAVNGTTVTIGSTVITATPAAATEEYTYAFAGWTAATTVTGNITVTANFTRTLTNYMIIFEMGEGTAIAPMRVANGTLARVLDSVTVIPPEHYHFVKWQLKTGENTYVDFVGDEIIENTVTVKAVYVIDTFTVRIAVNTAGYGTVSTESVANVPYGTVITTRDKNVTVFGTVITANETADTDEYDYEFVGFTNGTAMVTGNITVTANFTRTVKRYTVTWIDTQSVVSDKVETIEYGTKPTYPWSDFEKVSDGTYIYYTKVEKSTDGDTWTDASTYDGVYGGLDIPSTILPGGSDLAQFNAGLSEVTGDITYRVIYCNLNPVTAVSGGTGFAVVQKGLEFAFSNIKKDNTVNRVRIHSDLLRYYFKADNPYLTLTIAVVGDSSANITVETRFANPASAALNTVYGTGSAQIAYYMDNAAAAEDHLFVDVKINGGSATGFTATASFGEVPAEIPAEVMVREQVFNVLTSASSYGNQNPYAGHGNFGGVTTSGDSIIVNANVGGDGQGRGFVITPAAVTELCDSGVETLSFTITTTSGYVCIYHDTGNNKYALSVGSADGGDCMYYKNGDTVTVDIKALAEHADWARASFGIYFVITSNLSWSFYSFDGTVTFSDIAFTWSNLVVWRTPVKLKIATTSGDFVGNYDTGNYTTGSLADNKAILDLLYESDFRYVDLSMYSFTMNCDFMQDDWRNKVAELKAYAESKGMTFVQAHSQGGNPLTDNQSEYNQLLAMTLRQIEICGELSIENIVVHAGWHTGYTKQQWFDANKAFFDVLLDKGEECGVNILCENSTSKNMGTMYYINTGADMREFIEYVNRDNFHGCWDTGHANCEGDQYNDIVALGDELYAIHYNDNMGDSDSHIIPYFGTMNNRRVIWALNQIGYSGYFTFECDASVRMNNNWHGANDLAILSEKSISQLSGDRLGQEKLMYQLGVNLLSSYNMYSAQ